MSFGERPREWLVHQWLAFALNSVCLTVQKPCKKWNIYAYSLNTALVAVLPFSDWVVNCCVANLMNTTSLLAGLLPDWVFQFFHHEVHCTPASIGELLRNFVPTRFKCLRMLSWWVGAWRSFLLMYETTTSPELTTTIPRLCRRSHRSPAPILPG